MRGLRSTCVISLMAISGCALGAVKFPAAPSGLAPSPRQQVLQWVDGTRHDPSRPVRHNFSWDFVDKGNTHNGGNGSVLMVGRDSLRLDFRGPLGVYVGSGVIVGDSAVWMDPKDQVGDFIPNFVLLWAMLGEARPPALGAVTTAIMGDSLTSWRYLSGNDTTTYIRKHFGSKDFSVDVVQGGKLVGQVLTTRDSLGKLAKSVLYVKSAKNTLKLTFKRTIVGDSIPAGTWRVPVDSL